MTQEKVGRRGYLKYAGAGIVVVAVAGAGAYYATRPAEQTTVTSTIPPKPDRLIVRAWGGGWQDALAEGVSKPFTEKYGIKVEYDNTEDNILQAKMRELIPAGKEPPVDVNWTTTTNAFREAIWGFATPMSEELVPSLTELHDAAKPETMEGIVGWPFVNAYTYTYALAYRTDIVKEPPESWMDIWDSKWSKSIGMYDDGIGFAPDVTTKLGGGSIPDNMEPGWELLRQLKPNISFTGEDPDLTMGLVEGHAPIECTIPTNAIEAQRQGAPVAWTVPKEGVSMQNDALYVSKNLPESRTYWAMKYVDVAMSAEGQTVWCEYLGCPPMNKNATFSRKDDPAFPTTAAHYEKMIIIPYSTRVENEKDWFARFEEIMA